MPETLVRLPWRLGNSVAVAWGDPTNPGGPNGLRDLFITDRDTSYINVSGTVTLSRVINADGEQITGLDEDLACDYLSGSNGVHFYVLGAPEDYSLELGAEVDAYLDADAAAFLGVGKGRRIVRLVVTAAD